MPTIYADDSMSRRFAEAIANALVARPTIYNVRGEVDVRKPTGSPGELVLVAGTVAEKRKRSRYSLAISLDVSRNGTRQRIRVSNTLASRRTPTERDRLDCLACVAAHQLAPLLKKQTPPTKSKRLIHVDAYHAQSEPRFRKRVVAQLVAQGFRTRVTLGLSESKPDPECWGYLMVPFVSIGAGKAALSPSMAVAGGCTAKTKIRATIGPNVSDAAATAMLADKLAAWYGKLAAMAG